MPGCNTLRIGETDSEDFMPHERVPQAKGLLIRVYCNSSRRDEEWVAECPALGLFAHGTTLPVARQHLLTALDLFLTDCSERGTLEEVLRVRQVPHAWIETSLLASLDPAAAKLHLVWD
jgi:predicted RNase H-like HicB family nuclease